MTGHRGCWGFARRIACLLLLLSLWGILPLWAAGAEALPPEASTGEQEPPLASEIPIASETEAPEGFDPELYEEQKRAIGAEELAEAVPPEARRFLEAFGLTGLDPETLLNLNVSEAIRWWWEQALAGMRAPLLALAEVLGVLLLGSLLESVGEGADSTLTGVFKAVSALFLCAVLLPPLTDCASRATALAQGVAHFMLAYIPVFSAAVLFSGKTLSAGAGHLTLFAAMEGLGELLPAVLMPLVFCALGCAVASSLTDGGLGKAAVLAQKAASWVLGAAAAVLSGLLGLQTLLAKGADSVAARTVRFVITSAVPVVGSALSDALLTVKGCGEILKTGVGVFGLLTAAAAFLPILAELAGWSLCLKMGAAAGELFGQKNASALMESAAAVTGLLAALLLCMLLLCTVSTVLLLV